MSDTAHDPNRFGLGTPLVPETPANTLVCHKELGLGRLVEVYRNTMDGEPVDMAIVCFNDAEQHVADCALDDLTASFVALSTRPVMGDGDLGESYAPPGELVTFKLNDWKQETGEACYDVVFHPSGIWWNGNTLDEIRNNNPYVEVFMDDAAAIAAGRKIPDVRRPEIQALRKVMLDVLHDNLDEFDIDGNIGIPETMVENLRAACAAAGVSFDDFIQTTEEYLVHGVDEFGRGIMVPSGNGLLELKADEIDALAAHLGMGERLLEKNAEQLAKDVGLSEAEPEQSEEPPAPAAP